MDKRINQAGLDIIKEFEKGPGGASPALEAYRDPVGVWTIGWGHTRGVHPGDVISKADAEAFLRQDLTWAEDAVAHLVHSHLSSNQFSALVSFVFNVGVQNFRMSTMLKLLNAFDYDGASRQFVRWVYGGGDYLPGLKRRRLVELELFMK